MKKILLIIVSFILGISSMTVYAESGINGDLSDKIVICDVNIEFLPDDSLNEIGTMSIKKSLIINGEYNNLYPTFDNSAIAIENVKNKYEELLSLVAEKYSLSELSDDNWEDYLEVFTLYEADEEYQKEKSDILRFFDIYENNDCNNQILQIVNNFDNELYDELAMLLPYSSPYYKQYELLQSQISLLSSFDVDAAVDYAVTYATDPNISEYAYLGGSDCTNFASQILENGGYSQNRTGIKYLGWWHTKDGNNHTHSNSWTSANYFAKYMGITSQTETHFDLSEIVNRGDFIALDISGDGSWNHIGFVVLKDDYIGSYGYYDYLVAQHSSNYLAWTSSDKNGWDEQENCLYGVIRK